MRLIAVVTGADSATARANQAASLLNYGHSAYMPLEVLRDSRTEDTVKVYFGQADLLAYGAAAPKTIVIAKELRDLLTLDYQVPAYLEAPVTAGDKIGSTLVMVGDTPIAEVELVSLDDVPEAGVVKKLTDFIRLQIAELLKF